MAASKASAGVALRAAAAAARCRDRLELEAIDRARGVGYAQMAAACEALAQEGRGGTGRGGRSGWGAARERLRGHAVLIVGEHHGAVDGVTEDGEVVVPWDWACASSGGSGRDHRGGCGSEGGSFSAFR